jgi:hypothetical protein
MIGIRRTSNGEQVEFCERCGSICDQACRAEALRDQALIRGLLSGWRLA